MARPGYLYLMASGRNGTLYLGVTSDLLARVWQHRNDVVESFTKNMAATGWAGMKRSKIFSRLGIANCK